MLVPGASAAILDIAAVKLIMILLDMQLGKTIATIDVLIRRKNTGQLVSQVCACPCPD